jgi:hypothetical protein
MLNVRPFDGVRKKRNPYSEHHKEKVKLKELYYGLIILFAKALGMRLVPF